MLLAAATICGLSAGGCARLLGYDDLQVRTDAAMDSTADAPVSPDTPAPIDADDGSDSNDGASEIGDGDAAPERAQPPGRPPGKIVAAGSGTYWYAVSHFYFGMNDASEAASLTAWRSLGLDIDGVCTSASDSATSVGTCRRSPASPSTVLTDGDGCRDNNFGSSVMHLVSVANAAFETNANASIHDKGTSTWALALDDVDPSDDDPYVPGRLFRVVALQGGWPPLWDGTDVRVVAADSLAGGSLDTPIASFPKGYIRHNTWVSGDPVDRDLALPSSGTSLQFALKSVVLVVPLTNDRTKASGATLAGALPIEKMEAILGPIAAASAICPGSALYANALSQLKTFGDVVIGAPNLQDILRDCDGISVGLGFDLQGIKPVLGIDSSSSPPLDKCGDAGSD